MNQFIFKFFFLYIYKNAWAKNIKVRVNILEDLQHNKVHTCSFRSIMVKVFKVFFLEHSEHLSIKPKNWHVDQTEAGTYDHKEKDKEGSKLYSWTYRSPFLKVHHPQEGGY